MDSRLCLRLINLSFDKLRGKPRPLYFVSAFGTFERNHEQKDVPLASKISVAIFVYKISNVRTNDLNNAGDWFKWSGRTFGAGYAESSGDLTSYFKVWRFGLIGAAIFFGFLLGIVFFLTHRTLVKYSGFPDDPRSGHDYLLCKEPNRL